MTFSISKFCEKLLELVEKNTTRMFEKEIDQYLNEYSNLLKEILSSEVHFDCRFELR